MLENKYGFDALYDRFATRGIVGGSEKCSGAASTSRVIDGAVNGVARGDGGRRAVRAPIQSGLVRGYALVILGGAVAVLAYLLWLR